MVESANPSGEPQVQRRRSTRIVQTVPITVSGTDALGQPFKERTSALVINCHGCKYQSKHYVLKNHAVTLEIPHPEAGQPARTLAAKVVWVQRPRTVHELFQVAVQIEVPGNVWGVAFPPEDWFPYPEEAAPSIPAPPPPAPPEAKAEPSQPASLPPSKVRMLPGPAAPSAEALASVEKQIAKMIAEARGQIQDAAREAASSSVAAETGKLLREVEAQLRNAARKTVDTVSAQHLDEAVQRAVERIDQSRLQANGTLREKWQADFDSMAGQAGQTLAERFKQSEQELRKRFREHLDQGIAAATARLSEIEKHMEALRTEMAGAAATTQSRLDMLRGELASADAAAQSSLELLRAEAAAAGKSSASRLGTLRAEIEAAVQEATRKWQPELGQLSEAARAELARVEQAVKNLRAQVGAAEREDIDRLRTKWREHLESDMTLAGEEWNALVADAVSTASQRLARHWADLSDRADAEAEQAMRLRLGTLRQSFAEAAADAQQVLLAVRRDLEQDLFRAKGSLDDLRAATGRASEDAARLDGLRQSLAEALESQFQQALVGHMEALTAAAARQSETMLTETFERLRPAFDEEGRKSVERTVAEVDRHFAPRLENAERLLSELAATQQRAEEFLLAHRERIQQLSGEFLAQTDRRLKEARAQIEKEWDAVSRTQLDKCLAELEEKSTDATHTTFEALYKAADWYQKKAQTSMQSVLDKAIEQATEKLRDRAGELSRVFSLELEHYSRSYTEHTRGLLEDSAREVVGKNRETLEQAGQASAAALSDEAHRIATEKLRLFADESSASRDEMMAALDSHSESVQQRWIEFAGRSFTDFQEKIAARAGEQLSAAQREFQAGLLPIVEAWRAEREAQHREWLEKLNQVSSESVDQYQQRLQNTSNTWMVASVTTLNQHSKTVMETLAAAAETRLRDACSQALTGMAQMLADQMRTISAQLGSPPPAEKK